MGFADLIELARHKRTRAHTTLVLPDPEPAPAEGTTGYFQIRLAEMYLQDERRWFQEIVPATFLLADFNYGEGTVRQPFFVSNHLLSLLPQGIDPRKLPVRFNDTLVVGPTPYAGGDVGLFVGLFQSALENRRKALFSVFEKLFGSFDLGALSQYVKIADKIGDEIFRCLEEADIKCLLAERRIIGLHALPQRCYLAFLSQRDKEADTSNLEVHGGRLHRRTGGGVSPVEDVDFCLVRIEQLAVRNDYKKLDFYATWKRAEEHQRAGNFVDAQAFLLHCGNQIGTSADLTEDQKVALIELFQAQLLATRTLRSAAGANAAPTRSGKPAPARLMQARASAQRGYDEALMAAPFDHIAELTTRLSKDRRRPLEEADIDAYLKRPRTSPGPTPQLLVRALAAGSLALD